MRKRSVPFSLISQLHQSIREEIEQTCPDWYVTRLSGSSQASFSLASDIPLAEVTPVYTLTHESLIFEATCEALSGYATLTRIVRVGPRGDLSMKARDITLSHLAPQHLVSHIPEELR